MTTQIERGRSVSIVIAVKSFNPNLEQSIKSCLNLDYPNFEILVLPDEAFEKFSSKIKIIPTGNKTAGQKRNLALKHIDSEFIAFIDDDSYPRPDWLKNALKNFDDLTIAAVGGPSITPQEDTLKQKASGLIYESILVSGANNYRYIPKLKRFVDDFPTCNFIIRKNIFEELGGFNEDFWPGEDTILCLKLTKKFKKRIIYNPEVLIYHHRRSVFVPHLKQVANYALHRGFFVKTFPQTSFRIPYFMPSAFFLYLLLGLILAIYSSIFRSFYYFSLLFYLISITIVTIQKFIIQRPLQFRLIPYLFFGIILTHLVYGINFLKGLFSKKLRI